jgi:hypothetical protein
VRNASVYITLYQKEMDVIAGNARWTPALSRGPDRDRTGTAIRAARFGHLTDASEDALGPPEPGPGPGADMNEHQRALADHSVERLDEG